MSATHTIAIAASASHGERACSSTTATQAAISTSQPTTATTSGERGFQRLRSQAGTTISQNSVAGPQTASTTPSGQPSAKPASGENSRLTPISGTPATNRATAGAA